MSKYSLNLVIIAALFYPILRIIFFTIIFYCLLMILGALVILLSF